MNRKAFCQLLENYLDGKCTEMELDLIEHGYQRLGDKVMEIAPVELNGIEERLWNKIEYGIRKNKKPEPHCSFSEKIIQLKMIKAMNRKLLAFIKTAMQITFTQLLLCMLFMTICFADNLQDKTITGIVTSQAGQPLSGVSILLKGTKRGTVTDDFGRFQLIVPDENATLEISYVGFQPMTIQVGSQNNLQIKLNEVIKGLNDVVVIGYSTQRKKDLTGAVSVISNADINNIPVGGVDQIMQGKAPGVAVTAQTGAPGDAIAVRIRGIGTINDNTPLYIIDGVPTKTGINEISPNDIESINILKDASSAAIYGARAANGVVIITTKHGISGKTKVSLSAYTGTQTTGHLIKMANTQQYVTAYNKAAATDGRAANTCRND